MNEFFSINFFRDLKKSNDGKTREYGVMCDWSGVLDLLKELWDLLKLGFNEIFEYFWIYLMVLITYSDIYDK